jgi:hypothetical protein
MRYKYCVAILFIVAVISVCVLAMPVTAAKPGDSVSVAEPGGYIVTFYKVPSKTLSGMVSPMAAYSSISQGGYNWHSRNVNYYTTSLDFVLNWGNPSNSLRLRLFTPDGYVLGPYYDSYDGSCDGQIGVRISRSNGVAQGTWSEEVYGYQVSGTQSYSISN